MKFMIRFLLTLPTLLVIACGNPTEKQDFVFFGGEIVNPTSDYVVLYKNDIAVDTAILNDENHFAFKFKEIDEGLYHFDHKPELHYVYLESGDSLLIRLNTTDFDESLVFSGTGSEVNNFLIEMFLAFEEELPQVYKYYQLESDNFVHKMDSLHQEKLDVLEELKAEGNLSDDAMAIAKAAVDYGSYIYKEKYPFYHKKRTNEKSMHLCDDFYTYRKNVDLNNSDLAYFKPYYDFMLYHLGNVTYMMCQKNCEMGKIKNSSLLHFNKHKLKVVDSLVQEEELRDILFRNIAMNYLLKEHQTNDESQKFIKMFSELSKKEEHIAEINDLYMGIKRLQPNHELPNLMVLDTARRHVALHDIAKDNKTVFYFWTGSQKMHFSKVSKRVAYLKKKYTDHKFVGINIRTSEEQWMQMMKKANLDLSHQYKCDEFGDIQHALIIDGLDKCVIAKDSLVVDGFANLYASF